MPDLRRAWVRDAEPGRRLNALLVGISLLLAIGVCIGTGLITGWGAWYSPSLVFRQQTQSLLSGRFALSDSPANAHFDLVWSEGGVQHVWGLGAPLWRLPFEGLARAVGYDAFPDRGAFAGALALLTFSLLRTLASCDGVRDVSVWMKSAPASLAIFLTTVLFPPFLTLLRAPLNVYEEACAYGYLFSLGLFVGLLSFLNRPSFYRLCILCAFSGASAFVRPTMLAYGGATAAIAIATSLRLGWRWHGPATGVLLFGAALSALMYTNKIRFGSPLEFGYAFQLNLMVETRLEVPFATEPLWSAAKELLGSIFFTQRLNGIKFFDPDVVRWQSPTPRWRDFYHSTFDVTYLIGILSLCLLTAGKATAALRTHCLPKSLSSLAAAWSLLSIIPLTAFYLRSEVMSSRYVFDFAPALSIALTGLLWNRMSGGRSSAFVGVKEVALFGAALWWSYEVAASKLIEPPRYPLSHSAMRRLLDHQWEEASIPESYIAESNPRAYGIPSNRDGWRGDDGRTSPLALVFFNEPGRIEMEIVPAAEDPVTAADYESIRVRVGFEWLELESVKSGNRSTTLTFAPPRDESNRRGIQLLVLVFVRPQDYVRPYSPFRMLRLENVRTANPGL